MIKMQSRRFISGNNSLEYRLLTSCDTKFLQFLYWSLTSDPLKDQGRLNEMLPPVLMDHHATKLKSFYSNEVTHS